MRYKILMIFCVDFQENVNERENETKIEQTGAKTRKVLQKVAVIKVLPNRIAKRFKNLYRSFNKHYKNQLFLITFCFDQNLMTFKI